MQRINLVDGRVFLYDENTYELRQENKERPNLGEKVQGLFTRFMRVTPRGDLIFRTTSGTTPGKYWYQTIRFLDLDKVKDRKDLTDMEKVKLLYEGDIAVWCNDPSWLYYWQYRGTRRGFSIKPEYRPHRRNPEIPGTTCKHIERVLSVLGFHMTTIVKQYRRYGIFKHESESFGGDANENV